MWMASEATRGKSLSVQIGMTGSSSEKAGIWCKNGEFNYMHAEIMKDSVLKSVLLLGICIE